ncbi:hypothetical protein [Nocardia sp. alder85J]|uniref:hypothetical protein n=1 Tax=Nocardia sp. alder85J TaxID=2862949 RepID=UPI001CD2F6F3|nr:hypothetical protein [Nocardia sp. alder85J]MCX4093593.1 hypothetical protein [Nocardia sp. alder85J]
MLRQQGYNHAQADYNAILGDKGAPPEQPATPAPAVGVCQIPPPAAGGPGGGLDDAVRLAQKIGIPLPDGDTGKLGSVGDTWAALAAAQPVAGLSGELGRVVGLLQVQQSPEIEFVVTDLQQLQSSAQKHGAGLGGLANACHDHRAALDDLRAKLKTQLEDLGKELLKELAITAAIGIATSFITFGIGAAVASARAVAIAARWAKPIREIVEAWKSARNLKAGVKLEQDLATETKSLQDIEKLGQDLAKTEKAATSPAAADGALTDQDWRVPRYRAPPNPVRRTQPDRGPARRGSRTRAASPDRRARQRTGQTPRPRGTGVAVHQPDSRATGPVRGGPVRHRGRIHLREHQPGRGQ